MDVGKLSLEVGQIMGLFFCSQLIVLTRVISPEFVRLWWSAVELIQRRIFSPGTSAFRQESSMEDTEDVILVVVLVVQRTFVHWMLVIALESAEHFQVMESKMSFL